MFDFPSPSSLNPPGESKTSNDFLFLKVSQTCYNINNKIYSELILVLVTGCIKQMRQLFSLNLHPHLFTVLYFIWAEKENPPIRFYTETYKSETRFRRYFQNILDTNLDVFIYWTLYRLSKFIV